MGKNVSTLKSVSKDDEELDEQTNEELEEEETPKLSDSDRKKLGLKLLTEWKKTDNAVMKAREELDKAIESNHKALHNLLDRLGAGPWNFQGETVGPIIVRKGTPFIKGRNKKERTIETFD
jgi:hypothetical protein